MTEEKSNIESIPGHTNILLIAPHGVETDPYDDIGTAELTRQIQKHLGCSAIINTTYRKPTGKKLEKRNGGNLSLKKKVLNLNLVAQAIRVKDFTDKIKKVVDTDGLTYVFWIHGIDDGNIEQIGKDVQCLLGYGQPNTKKKEETRLTAEQTTIDTVLRTFEKNGIKTIPAPETSNYRGWKKTYMNQWFLLEKYSFDKVQSIQLEFKKTGCRRPEDLEATAKKLADAISTLVQPAEKKIEPADKKEQPADKALVTEKITDPEEIKGAIDVGEPVTDPLVETAYQKLSNIFSKNYEQALMEAGQYIVRTFYAGENAVEGQAYDEDLVLDEETIENAKSNKSPRQTSLHQLIQRLNENKDSKSPSRAWIYNSVNLIVQWHDMKQYLSENDFYTYRNLLLSHKTALLQVKNKEDKKTFIYQIQQQALSVRNLKNKISESKKSDKEPSLYSIIKDPDELFSDRYSEQFKLKELDKIRVDKLKKMYGKMFELCKAYESERIRYDRISFTYDTYVMKYLDFLTDIKTVIEYKENPNKDKKLKKSKTKMARP